MEGEGDPGMAETELELEILVSTTLTESTRRLRRAVHSQAAVRTQGKSEATSSLSVYVLFTDVLC